SQALASLTTRPLSSSLSSLVVSSRTISSNKDFHFFNNFDEFKTPVNRIASKSHSLLDIDSEEASDWFLNVNDEVLKRFESLIGSISTEVGLDLKSGQNPFTLKSEILLPG
ncbi:hypothetical protein LINPERPRIM_LOCUS29385, partial [Linum perenne]